MERQSAVWKPLNPYWAPVIHGCHSWFVVAPQLQRQVPAPCSQHIEAGTKWHPFGRRHFKCILLNENVWISINISLNFVPKGRINNNPALVQVMAWCWPGDKPLSALFASFRPSLPDLEQIQETDPRANCEDPGESLSANWSYYPMEASSERLCYGQYCAGYLTALLMPKCRLRYKHELTLLSIYQWTCNSLGSRSDSIYT